jgi:hypothetical protein
MSRRRRGLRPRHATEKVAGEGADGGAWTSALSAGEFATEKAAGEGGYGGAWTSALSAGEFAAIGSVGFEPVGQVMGSVVLRIGRSGRRWGYHDCQFPYPGDGDLRYGSARDALGARRAPIALSGNGALSGTVVGVYDRARHLVLERMSAECRALGGDGVVAAGLTMAPLEVQPDCTEFKVIGTAVRARGSHRVRRPFTSHLDGYGFAKLIGAGWVPVELLVGMSIGVRHDDYASRSGRFSSRNTEISGWSELVRAVRSDARRQLRLHGAPRGGNGLIMADSTLRVWEETCLRAVRTGEGAELHDHLAESTMVGSTIAQFEIRGKRPRTLSVMPLGDRGEVLRARLAALSGPDGEPGQDARSILKIGELKE